MNPFTNILLLANPVLTAILTIVVFLESKKQRGLLEAVEKAVIDSSKQVIAAVEKQKEGFDVIALSLKALSEDQEKSVETFMGIGNALTTSSTTNQQSLNNVVTALVSSQSKQEEIASNTCKRIEDASTDLKRSLGDAYSDATSSIREVSSIMGEHFNQMSERITASEAKTLEAFGKTIESIKNDAEKLKQGIENNSEELSLINSTLKNAVSI